MSSPKELNPLREQGASHRLDPPLHCYLCDRDLHEYVDSIDFDQQKWVKAGQTFLFFNDLPVCFPCVQKLQALGVIQ